MQADQLSLFSIDITQAARLYLSKHMSAPYLRLSIVKTGKCAGWAYHFDEARSYEETDYLVFVTPELSIVIDKVMGDRCFQGGTLDLVHEHYGESLRFSSPKAKKACGCGESFNLDE